VRVPFNVHLSYGKEDGGRSECKHCVHFLRTQELPLNGVVWPVQTAASLPGEWVPRQGVLQGTPARVPSRIPGGDSSFPNGGPFGEAQTKSTTYDSGGAPEVHAPAPQPKQSLQIGRHPPGGVSTAPLVGGSHNGLLVSACQRVLIKCQPHSVRSGCLRLRMCVTPRPPGCVDTT